MRSSRPESQGQVGDLRSKTREELQELLVRQEHILSNRRFLRSLPDGGRKISDFAERVRLAVVERDEDKQRPRLLFSVGTELQSKYQQAFSQRQHGVACSAGTSSNSRPGEVASAGQMDVSHSDHSRVTVGAGQTPAARLASGATGERDLIQALEKVSLSDASSTRAPPEASRSDAERGDVFLRTPPHTKPNYLEVLERTERASGDRKQRFKPNHLSPSAEHHSSSESLSGDQPLRRAPPLSAEARKERDRKHLDDITAARQPPLHHSPALLLSLEESASLLEDQARKHQELQSRIASQKLSEALKVSMGSFVPETGPQAAYRDAPLDEDQPSSEED
ncbi:protein GRINL1A [Gadus morhua]|uniref:RNA polymerase II subunit M n=1 Tax=Gadus morhua TaxID=8049 RepID=A0A8C5CU71_GADMO|nr:protein GRINL1A [Gadus morhua]